MLEFHDPIPDISAQRCGGLIVQEYWYKDDLVSDANVVFLRVEDGTWHRFFIDAGVVFWRLIDAPDEPFAEGNHRYPHKDIGAMHGLVGSQLLRVSAVGLSGGCQIRLDFDGGRAVILRNIDDRSELALLLGDRRAR